MAVTRHDAAWFSAVSREILDRIPERLRLSRPRKGREAGADVHEASSTRNFNEAYTLCDFRIGPFRFSVSGTTFRKFLPKAHRNFLRRKPVQEQLPRPAPPEAPPAPKDLRDATDEELFDQLRLLVNQARQAPDDSRPAYSRQMARAVGKECRRRQWPGFVM